MVFKKLVFKGVCLDNYKNNTFFFKKIKNKLKLQTLFNFLKKKLQQPIKTEPNDYFVEHFLPFRHS
jgi:5-bromo-4-chloroindolyl phosphate hydrolysis protein